MRGRYIGDEPDGLVPAPILAEAYQRIHQIDSRPVFSIFGSVVPYHQHKGAFWKDYVNSSDIVGFDVDQLSAEDPPMETSPSSNSTG